MVFATPQPLKIPRLRDGLTVQAISQTEYVIKRHDSREYFSVGAAEAWFIQQLQEQKTFPEIAKCYQEKFNDSVTESDFAEFLGALDDMGLIQKAPPAPPARTTSTPEKTNSGKSTPTARGNNTSPTANKSTTTPSVQKSAPSTSKAVAPTDRTKTSAAASGQTTAAATSIKSSRKRWYWPGGQNPLFFRLPLFDPDQFLGKLVRVVPFIWTRAFLVLTAFVVVVAFCVMTSRASELALGLPTTPGWRDAILFILVMVACTSAHEVAHGATLKHFGGEVHDTGLLFMFFMPCMYCNVSDAWLLPDKWKRLLITAAGGLCDLWVWALGVFIWRITQPGTAVHHLAFFALTICGGRSLLNFNPLLRLDGYYLLSDWLSIPNLRTRSLDYWMGHMRWFLWGAERPPSVRERRIFLVYGFMCWVFAIVFLDIIFLQFAGYFGGQFGVTGLILVSMLLAYALRRVFKGFFSSEFAAMLKSRPNRRSTWAVGILAIAILLFLVPVKFTASGNFEVRPGGVVQLHVPVNGTLQNILVDDGSMVEAGQVVAELRSSSLESDITRTEDVLREVEANLNRLRAGARPEELTAQKERVRRAREWYELGVSELKEFRAAWEQEQLIQQHRIKEVMAELENAREEIKHSEHLYQLGALAGAQLRNERLQIVQLESRLSQAQATANALQVVGISSRETEVASRAQDLEQEEDRLKLMQAGNRPEEIQAEEAKHERVLHDLAYLRSQREKLVLKAPAAGLFASPRLRERLGTAVPQDSVFATIEQPGTSHVEIFVSEDEAAGVKPGQPVSLKARSLPFETFEATVESLSATAGKADALGQNYVTVHCEIRDPDGRLKSGMSGFGRIVRGWNSIGGILITRGMAYLRTEFWW
ncbi:MAG: HlyD family efflux transporter periplasmic adaptor subunit [Planctomycetaceae bacterium]|nr:HlyD family efflux transporter periplasmic adaptor subunit [Planctomycetaceae bacterium]